MTTNPQPNVCDCDVRYKWSNTAHDLSLPIDLPIHFAYPGPASAWQQEVPLRTGYVPVSGSRGGR
jgi:hypothetical protein